MSLLICPIRYYNISCCKKKSGRSPAPRREVQDNDSEPATTSKKHGQAGADGDAEVFVCKHHLVIIITIIITTVTI
jgi:hypothetical protein